jgi:hypothetical protein
MFLLLDQPERVEVLMLVVRIHVELQVGVVVYQEVSISIMLGTKKAIQACISTGSLSISLSLHLS